jgi:putative acetyltransferase
MADAISSSCDPTSPLMFTISTESPEHPDIIELLRIGTEFTRNMQPPHINFLLDVTDLQGEGVEVYAAREIRDSTASGKALGMAALVPISADLELGEAAEIKRMYVHSHARGRGVGRTLVKCIEKEALKRGYERVMVETGYEYVEARKLYEKLGYTYIERFGPYRMSEKSVCMQMLLRTAAEEGRNGTSS